MKKGTRKIRALLSTTTLTTNLLLKRMRFTVVTFSSSESYIEFIVASGKELVTTETK